MRPFSDINGVLLAVGDTVRIACTTPPDRKRYVIEQLQPRADGGLPLAVLAGVGYPIRCDDLRRVASSK